VTQLFELAKVESLQGTRIVRLNSEKAKHLTQDTHQSLPSLGSFECLECLEFLEFLAKHCDDGRGNRYHHSYVGVLVKGEKCGF
jgi:hypothetical protein